MTGGAEPWTDTLWIAGSPCSGKSTVAASIASARGMRLYCTDDRFDAHLDALVSDGAPVATKIATLPVGDRLAQPVAVQLSDVVALHHALFPRVLADLRALRFPLVVEGAVLMPELLTAIGVPSERVVVVVPTPAFQLEHYGARRWAPELVAATDDPVGSFDRWMRRDIAYAELVTAQARDHGFRVVVNDGTQTVDALVEAVSAICRPAERAPYPSSARPAIGGMLDRWR